ncbi:mucin-3A-like [Anoplophora glabripennis]|uniref:mucin-3A-like n=1 Tax=Anoplophora glabripennis TaxID=217634 RepID=UPI000873B6FE|nr:mucin-3A-like [Anoplophora glabripennis]
MPYIRMKRLFLRGLLWLYLLLEFGYMALSLEPGYLDFDNLPDTNFSCLGKVIGGYYADLETNCQMFHVCTIGQLDEPMDIRFLCLNGTVFDQETRVCERIDEVDCSKSEQFYGLNLELYGNTQPPILEDSPETEQPLIIKSTTATTSTTTSKPKATNTHFYTSAKPSTITTQAVAPHHFPVANSPDIRFNPEEINISLHPGAPPDIRTKPATYQQQSYSDNNKNVVVTTHSESSDAKKVSVTTHSEVFDDGKVLQSEDFAERPQTQTPRTQKPQHHNFGLSNSQTSKNFHHSTPSDINYEFTFRQTEPSFPDFHTELPQSFFHSDFHTDQDYAGHHHNPQSQQFKSSTFHDDFISTTKGVNHFQQKVPTTVRNILQSLKPPAPNQPHHYNHHQTEKPQRVQLPLPLLPTLPPLTFSSPAPFALQHHIDTKRYTKDHPSPPRIVISASASVSDASGRRLNYSLGTIGAAEFLEQPPHSYDEYKDEDVGLDPFYHDVPKLKRSRSKRDAIKHSDIIRNEEEAVNVLKFLFDWYRNNEKTATESTTLPTIVTTAPATPKTDIKDVKTSPNKAAEAEYRNNEKNTSTSTTSTALPTVLTAAPATPKTDIKGVKTSPNKASQAEYKNNKKAVTESTTVPTVITTAPTTTKTDINDVKTSPNKAAEVELHAEASEANLTKENHNNFGNSALFDRNSKFNIIGNVKKEKNIQERRSTDAVTKQMIKTTTAKTTTTTQISIYEKDFLDELFGDYVNDNFEPIVYNQKYEEDGKKQDTSTEAVPVEQVKNQTPRNHVDHNIEPIYFKDRIETRRNIETKVSTSIKAETKLPLKEKTKETEDILPSTSTYLTSNHVKLSNKESKELSSNSNRKTDNEPRGVSFEIGDTETNNIKQNIQKEETSTKASEPIGFSEPKSEILEPVTTEKTTTTTTKPKTSHRRGRMRYHTTTEREKELENKNVVLEKITERAHTAKDDFNYLRTLYKVYTTTPTYNLPETRSFEENGNTKTQRVINDYFDLKEASPSDKVLRTLEETSDPDIDNATSQPDLIPIITTEATTTTAVNEKVFPPTNISILNTSVGITSTERTSTTTSTERTSSTTTTEKFTPPITTSEKPFSTSTIEEFIPLASKQIIPSSTISQMITPLSTTTSEKTISRTTVTEQIMPITTSERISTTTTIEKYTPLSTKSEKPLSTSTTEKFISSATIANERIVSSGTLSQITSSGTTTSEKIPSSTPEEITPQSITNQVITSSATTVANIPSSKTVIPSSTTTTERITLLSATSESTLPSSTTTTDISIPPRRDSRRRGRTRFGDEPNRSRSEQRSHHRRRPDKSDTSTSRSNSTPHYSSTTEENTIHKKSGYQEETIEENGSNINRVISYPKITTEYNPILPNDVLLSGSTETTEFFTQLTLNYKKIFEDLSQTSGPATSQVLDESTLAVTETNYNITSSVKPFEQHTEGVKPQGELITHGDPLPTTIPPKEVSIVEEVVQSTITPDNITPFAQLKSESQVLQTDEQTTIGKPDQEAEYFNTETIETLETVPTTSLITEKSVKAEVITETALTQSVDEVFNKMTDTTTEKLLEETKPVEIIAGTSSTTENINSQEKAVVTTQEAVHEIKEIKLDSTRDRNADTTLELTTTNLPSYQTTVSPIRDDTPLIPRITEIFNLFGITRDKDIFGIPTTLLTTEEAVKSTEASQGNFDEIVSTQRSEEKNILDISTTTPSTETYQNADVNLETRTEYPTTIFVVRTTDRTQMEAKLKEEVKAEENVDQLDIYPSTVYVIRTTERPKVSQHQEEEKLYTLHQLSKQNLQKLIEEIEENTKSVVATTNVPPMVTNPKNTIATDEKINKDFYEDVKSVIATTERRDDLEELTSLFEYTTRSNIVATTPVNIVLSPQEEKTESSTAPSTTEVPRIYSESPTTSANNARDTELMSTSQIERLTISESSLRTTPTTVTTTIASRRGSSRRSGGRVTGRKNSEARRGAARHRFSTESFTKRPDGGRHTVEEDILDELTKSSRGATTESYRRRLRVRPNGSRVKDTSTDAPLQKSASPTQPERVKDSLPTTPLSKEGNGKRHFIFNCFGKKVDKFYPDPRDCRLFHYCTQGYNKNQLIDMKFVCDLNTYFDDVKLTCSKRKPRRCM